MKVKPLAIDLRLRELEMKWAWYNENDAQKAAWLRELIRANVIAPGEVDERSIADVGYADLRGFTQCHFFAGIGVWSYALRLAEWPDDRPVWTGSCPCPSFSCAGKGQGFDDPRHLWPAWARLIGECRPATVFGEQADDAIGFGWLDLVQVDLERQAYAVGKAVLGACSVGAPHIRQRLYFCAHAEAAEVRARHGEIQARTGAEISDGSGDSVLSRLAPHSDVRLPGHRDLQRSGEQRLLAEDCGTGEREHAECRATERRRHNMASEARSVKGEAQEWERFRDDAGSNVVTGNSGGAGFQEQPSKRGVLCEKMEPSTRESVNRTGATRSFWADCDWWHGRDEKYRPIEPGLFPLAHGASNRVLKLRGYGDAIIPQVAAEFICAAEESFGVN